MVILNLQNGVKDLGVSKVCKLYLPNPKYVKYEVDSMRWEHVFKSIPLLDEEGVPTGNEVRIYIEGQDFYESEAPHPLPYATLNGKKKSFDNFWKEMLGEERHEYRE